MVDNAQLVLLTAVLVEQLVLETVIVGVAIMVLFKWQELKTAPNVSEDVQDVQETTLWNAQVVVGDFILILLTNNAKDVIAFVDIVETVLIIVTVVSEDINLSTTNV